MIWTTQALFITTSASGPSTQELARSALPSFSTLRLAEIVLSERKPAPLFRHLARAVSLKSTVCHGLYYLLLKFL